jgi:hypothetical protein
MGIFEDLFPNLESFDDDYDPYDTTGKYGQYGTCCRGKNYSSTNWCCMECERDRMRRRRQYDEMKKRCFDDGNFNFTSNRDTNKFGFFDSDKCFDDFKFCDVSKNRHVSVHWKNLNLIPPKSKQEIKKSYRRLCLTHHPDKGGKAIDFVRITDSYNNLMCIVS